MLILRCRRERQKQGNRYCECGKEFIHFAPLCFLKGRVMKAGLPRQSALGDEDDTAAGSADASADKAREPPVQASPFLKKARNPPGCAE